VRETEEEFVTLDKVRERERENSSSLLLGKEFVPLNTGVCERDRRDACRLGTSVFVCACVCLCVREREWERESRAVRDSRKRSLLFFVQVCVCERGVCSSGTGVRERESRGVGYSRSLVEEEFVTLDKVCERETEESCSFLIGSAWKNSVFALGTGLCVCEREKSSLYILGKGLCVREREKRIGLFLVAHGGVAGGCERE